jgi:positive regulator of sigma E activity
MAPSLGDGETVEVSIDAGGLHRTVVMLFGLPLALLFGGAWLGAQVGGEQLSAVAGLAGAMAGLLWFRRAGPGLMRSLAMRVTASPRTVISHGTPVDDRLVSARSEVWS